MQWILESPINKCILNMSNNDDMKLRPRCCRQLKAGLVTRFLVNLAKVAQAFVRWGYIPTFNHIQVARTPIKATYFLRLVKSLNIQR